jgi:DNA mismatch repair protein MutS
LSRALAHIDVFAALAEIAVRNNYVRPVLNEGTTIKIKDGRHPVVEPACRGSFSSPMTPIYPTRMCNWLF